MNVCYLAAIIASEVTMPVIVYEREVLIIHNLVIFAVFASEKLVKISPLPSCVRLYI